jgi:hypothetical protein
VTSSGPGSAVARSKTATWEVPTPYLTHLLHNMAVIKCTKIVGEIATLLYIVVYHAKCFLNFKICNMTIYKSVAIFLIILIHLMMAKQVETCCATGELNTDVRALTILKS